MKKSLGLVICIVALFSGRSMVMAKSGSDEALQRATHALQLGNGAYEKNDYAKAADYYRQALDEGVVNARLYYNYANSQFRLNQLGMAILYFEKAHKLDPNDEDIVDNLRFANAQTIDKNPLPETNILTKVLWFLHSSYSINIGLWICLGLFTGIFLFGMLAVYSGPGLRGVLIALIILDVLSLCVFAPSLIYKIKQQESVQYGIVIKPAVEMFSGPGETFQVLTKVHEGTKFEIVDTHGDWVSVKLLNGKGGFVRFADLGKV